MFSSESPGSSLGIVIFIEGIPSSGKTRVSLEIEKYVDVHVIHGDDLVKKWMRRREFTPEFAHELFLRLLDKVDSASRNQDVVVDMTIPARFLTEARRRFPQGIFVSLRVEENAWRAREHKRKRNVPLIWNDEIASQQAPNEQFDLVVDTTERTPAECAEFILAYIEE